ncbi:MAG: type IV toxin-antitoxin system AbiEi family antitoxin domain-containing protein [Elusimicrobia bacterium]|nr:type IV toxin-antitoxin system AbiEi family antitoxin domain-containing protein [Elusimicrobiota bacterium]
MTSLRLQKKLATRGLKLFTPTDFRRALGLSPLAAYRALQRYVQQGAISRLRNGLYILKWTSLDPLLIANHLYRPSYLSYETALSYHNLIPEAVYAIVSATSRRSHEFEVNNQAFIYHAIKRHAFTGYKGVKLGPDIVLMADPEKALCDYLHLVFLRKKNLNDRIAWNKITQGKLLRYANLFKPEAFSRWVKNVIPR